MSNVQLMDRTPLGQKVSSFHMYVVGHSFSVHCTFSVLVHQLAQEEKDSGHPKYSTCTKSELTYKNTTCTTYTKGV